MHGIRIYFGITSYSSLYPIEVGKICLYDIKLMRLRKVLVLVKLRLKETIRMKLLKRYETEKLSKQTDVRELE